MFSKGNGEEEIRYNIIEHSLAFAGSHSCQTFKNNFYCCILSCFIITVNRVE